MESSPSTEWTQKLCKLANPPNILKIRIMILILCFVATILITTFKTDFKFFVRCEDRKLNFTVHEYITFPFRPIDHKYDTCDRNVNNIKVNLTYGPTAIIFLLVTIWTGCWTVIEFVVYYMGQNEIRNVDKYLQCFKRLDFYMGIIVILSLFFTTLFLAIGITQLNIQTLAWEVIRSFTDVCIGNICIPLKDPNYTVLYVTVAFGNLICISFVAYTILLLSVKVKKEKKDDNDAEAIALENT